VSDIDYSIWSNDKQIASWRSNADLYQDAIEILGEAIQNSVRKLIPKKSAQLIIDIDLKNNRFRVVDNAGGFDTLRRLGLDDTEHTKNHQNDPNGGSGFGVGLNSIIANSNKFRIETFVEDQGKYGYVEILNFFNLSSSSEEDVVIKEKISNNVSNGAMDIRPITVVEFELRKDYFQNFVDEFDSVSEDDDERVRWLLNELKLRTPLGFTNGLFGKQLPKIEVAVKITNPLGVDSNTQLDFGFSSYNQVKDAVYVVNDSKGSKSTTTVAKDEILYYRSIPTKKESLLISVIGFAVNGTVNEDPANDRWERNFPLNISERAPGRRFFLSINGFLQSFNCPLPSLAADARMENWTTLVIDTNINVVEKGRNSIKTEHLSSIKQAIKDAVKMMNNRLKKGAPKKTAIVNKDTILKTVSQIAKGKKVKKFIQTVGLIQNDSIFERVSNEQETIGVFVEMVSKKLIRDIRFLEITGHGSYDFLVAFDLPLKLVGNDYKSTFIKSHSEDTKYSSLPGKNYTVGEAKFDGNELVKQISDASTAKYDFQIGFGVCWKFSDLPENSLYRIRKCPENKKIHPKINYVIELKSNPDQIFIPMFVLSKYAIIS